MKLSNQGLSSRDEFRILIENIGFRFNNRYNHYEFKKFRISLNKNDYTLYLDYLWINCKFEDLEPIKNNFKKEIRSFKLKQLLYFNIS